MSREERKVVTILFTDLVGFTSRAEELDPEDVRALLTPYYARLREQIEQRGGTVEKFIGDAVMAVFGAPVAHEDDPVRAVLTAIAIRDGSPDLEIRTAVHTGEALVALDADVASGEAFVSGDVVNTAARLQSAAPVNGILVGEATYRATRHVIDYRDAEPVEAKGKSRPVLVWEVDAARPRYGSDVEQAARTALVGREREVFLLTDAFQRSKSEETAQLVTLVGVPGIGKSRLVAELFAVLDADPDVYWWRQGRSLPYGESRSVWALGEIVKAQAGILESDDAQTAQEKVAAICEDEWVLSHLRPLAGVGGEIDESRDRRVEAFSAWRRFFESLAEERPLVLVFEDLHWADDTLIDFVDYLAEWVSGVPILVVATARPELLDRRPGWGGGKRNSTMLSIGALSNEETAKLLPILPADTQQLVLERAEGNPLYAAEFARMIVERPGADVPLPETVQGVIAARIDQLAPEEKALAQDASVYGKVFWPSGLESASDDALHALERKEFIRRDRRSAVAGETQYAFQHLLVRDVAYGQIPRVPRMEKHRAAASWIESLSPDRSEDRAEMLAHHYREALALAEAAGLDGSPLRAPALAALAEASERAAALSSWATAAALAEEALTLANDADPVRADLQLRLARAKAWTVADTDPLLAAEARDAFLARGQVDRAAECEALLSWKRWWTGDGTGARKHAGVAVELTADLPTSVGKAHAYGQAARLEGISGENLERAIELATLALGMADELDRDDLRSNALNSRGISKSKLGDLSGIDDLRRAVELADSSNSSNDMTVARNNLAAVLSAYGRVREAGATWEEAIEVGIRQGSPSNAHWPEMALVVHEVSCGNLSRALTAIDDLERRVSEGTQIRNGLTYARGWVLGVRGETEEALRQLEASLAGALLARDAQVIAPALAGKLVTLCVAGRANGANEVADELLATPRYLEPGYTWDAVFVFVELGRETEWLAAQNPDLQASEWVRAGNALAAGDLLGAAERYRAMGVSFLEAWARLLAAERGDFTQVEPARAFFAEEGAAPFVSRCEAVLAASA